MKRESNPSDSKARSRHRESSLPANSVRLRPNQDRIVTQTPAALCDDRITGRRGEERKPGSAHTIAYL
jgi:hypothetical protein